jgi:hypothetical protein
MAEDLLTQIEGAIARAANKETVTYEEVRKWLSLRKDYLDQNAARSRTVFWRWVTCVLLAVAALLLILWLSGVFTPAAGVPSPVR